MLMSLSVHGHCYILVTSKSQEYSIRGDYPKPLIVCPNKLLNRLVTLVTHLVMPILIISDLQTNSVAPKSKNAWLVLFVAPRDVYP